MCKNHINCNCKDKQEVLRLFKIRDSLKILSDLNYEMEITDGERGRFLYDEYNHIQKKINNLLE